MLHVRSCIRALARHVAAQHYEYRKALVAEYEAQGERDYPEYVNPYPSKTVAHYAWQAGRSRVAYRRATSEGA
jgi:hypothetical protein